MSNAIMKRSELVTKYSAEPTDLKKGFQETEKLLQQTPDNRSYR